MKFFLNNDILYYNLEKGGDFLNNFRKLFSLCIAVVIIFTTAACNNKKTNNNASNSKPVSEIEKETEIANKGDDFETKDEPIEEDTDEQDAINCIASYVKAAKKLDFNAMSKFISDSSTLPILDSYRDAYSKYNITDSRIKELCIARLGTYKFIVQSTNKIESGVSVKVKIFMVNMESLQNKWMEKICNNYPEYASLTEEQMTSEVVDVLIKTMIEVLNESESSETIIKDFEVKKNNNSWIINAKNSDFFISN